MEIDLGTVTTSDLLEIAAFAGNPAAQICRVFFIFVVNDVWGIITAAVIPKSRITWPRSRVYLSFFI
jgi:hypothetical protein